MPRVNRDLQRRMAARRERERRRPSTEQRYRFASPGATTQSDATPVEHDSYGATPAASRPSSGLTTARTVGASTSHRPFSSYLAEYAYVGGDLRRVAAVVGSLLLILIVLYLVFPH